MVTFLVRSALFVANVKTITGNNLSVRVNTPGYIVPIIYSFYRRNITGMCVVIFYFMVIGDTFIEIDRKLVPVYGNNVTYLMVKRWH